MADLENGSTVGGYPIIHEGNIKEGIRLGDVPNSMASKSYCDGRYSIVYTSRTGISPKDGDVLIESGLTISIYANGWRQVFPN